MGVIQEACAQLVQYHLYDSIICIYLNFRLITYSEDHLSEFQQQGPQN